MDGDGGFLQIAFELKTGGVDEPLVIGIVGDGGQFASDIGAAHPSQIDVGKPIGGRQKSGWLGRCMLAEYDHQGDDRSYQGNR